MKKTIQDWFYGLAAHFYDAGVQKLVTQYKCMSLGGDYVGSPLNYSLTVFFTSSLPMRVP
jgi:hypothetical protein